MQKKLIVMATCAALALAGCAKTGNKSKQAGGDYYGSADSSYGEDVTYQAGAGNNSRFYGQGGSQSAETLRAQRIFRFGFDRYDVNGQDLDAVYAHADYLREHPGTRLRVEGHTDERGSREYNIGLGERRAKAVSNVFISRGVSPSQFSVVSYGEEKPEVSGASEESYRMNRRAVIVYEE